MLSNSQEKLIKSLQTKKGRDESNLCLVEGNKVIETAGKAVEFIFTEKDTKNFKNLVSTETPQPIAAVAKIPSWTKNDLLKKPIIVVLDGVQDPGNVGAIARLCLGFNASLILIESADLSSPKVIRSSVGALFQVPWIKLNRKEAEKYLNELNLPIYRLEARNNKNSITLDSKSIKNIEEKLIIIAGSEGHGITLQSAGKSLMIAHKKELESLNVGHALAIVLSSLYSK